jgi:hypothetical protein
MKDLFQIEQQLYGLDIGSNCNSTNNITIQASFTRFACENWL